MWPVYSEDCGYCFISLLGKISDVDKAKTKDLTEKLNIGLISPFILQFALGSDLCNSEK